MRKNVPPGWAVMEHRAIQFRPMPMGMPFMAAVFLATGSAVAIAAFGYFTLTLLIDVGLIFLAKMLVGWHPFGWQIMLRNFFVPRALWS